MSRPEVWSLDDLLHADVGHAVAWVTPSVQALVARALPYPLCPPLMPLPGGVETLVVVGGGTLIDEAKAWVHDHAPAMKLVAIPSLWGSGAEASPVVVLHRNERKHIRLDAGFLPYARVVWPALAESVPPRRARDACGDCWAHALEGFVSPLAAGDLRTELSALIRSMLAVPLSNDPRWFELSAHACAGQARSSVGLVHGMAHTLEGPLRAVYPDDGWGHAKLCALFLWPVISLNRHASGVWDERLHAYDIDVGGVSTVAKSLFDAGAYARALPLLRAHWQDVLRDPCTRTNCVLVRSAQLSYLETAPLE